MSFVYLLFCQRSAGACTSLTFSDHLTLSDQIHILIIGQFCNCLSFRVKKLTWYYAIMITQVFCHQNKRCFNVSDDNTITSTNLTMTLDKYTCWKILKIHCFAFFVGVGGCGSIRDQMQHCINIYLYNLRLSWEKVTP